MVKSKEECIEIIAGQMSLDEISLLAGRLTPKSFVFYDPGNLTFTIVPVEPRLLNTELS